jgi:ribosomal protein L17
MTKCPFMCPRCGYSTFYRNTMITHMNRKKICPAALSSILLNEEIKMIILRDRVYRPQVDTLVTPATTHITNNLQIIQNVILNASPYDKLKAVMEYKNIKQIPFEDDIEEKFREQQSDLVQNIPGYKIDIDCLLEMIDVASMSES